MRVKTWPRLSLTLTSFVILILMVLSSCEQRTSIPEKGVPLQLAEQRKAAISNVHYRLYFSIPAVKEEPVKGKVEISFTAKSSQKPVVLDFKQDSGTVTNIIVNGHEEKVHHEKEHIIISTEHLTTGTNKIAINFTAGNAALNRNNDYMYALFVPEKARTAFPCFDQPDMKAIFELTLDIPRDWKTISNGELIKSTDNGKYIECRFAPSDTISTYLFSFTAGKYKSESRIAGGRNMQFLYRETDSAKLKYSMQAIFEMHASSLEFLEKYTDVPYPFKKFGFAAIPDFQFGGMEHPGAIWYNANQLFLDSSATRTQLINRANLIAHETSHMWFGDLVTMQWFNDVWMKEVYANFMADKIVSVILKDDNADLKFVTSHYPAAYQVDRTKGANAIRQPLENLNEAGSLYGGIIYHKAPIMMQQLERLIGEDTLRQGLQAYVKKYAFNNATWPDLIDILDKASSHDLAVWNDEWVNKPGRKMINELITDTHKNTYGLFNVDTARDISKIREPALRALLWINLYENVIEGRYLSPKQWLNHVKNGLEQEKEELISQLLLNQLQHIYWKYLSAHERQDAHKEWEETLQQFINKTSVANIKKQFFMAWVNVSMSGESLDKLHKIWNNKLPPEGVSLNDDDYTNLAAELVIKGHRSGSTILNEQLSRINNADKKLRWQFLLPALSADEKVRDEFFNSLKELKNRRKEAWVNTGLGYLHHPLRENASLKYIRPSLDMLEEIQKTGDIFFPLNWLDATLGGHQSPEAEKIVNDFTTEHPGYNKQLMNKLLQAADPLFRTNKIRRLLPAATNTGAPIATPRA